MSLPEPPLKTKISGSVKERIRSKYTAGPPRSADKALWLHFWQDYYDNDPPPPSVLERSWSRICDAGDEVIQGIFLYERRSQELAGFAHCIWHPSTVAEKPSCYVEDGYVAPAHRSSGGMLVLYEAVIEHAKRKGCDTLYWMTRSDNHPARRFYARIAQETNWVRYEYDFGEDS